MTSTTGYNKSNKLCEIYYERNLIYVYNIADNSLL